MTHKSHTRREPSHNFIWRMDMRRWIPAFAGMTLIFLLAACISGVKDPETYTDKSGNTTVIESDHEMCVRACNETYSRCMDTQSAQDNSGVNGPRGMFGASADCRNDLKDCLPDCQTR